MPTLHKTVNIDPPNSKLPNRGSKLSPFPLLSTKTAEWTHSFRHMETSTEPPSPGLTDQSPQSSTTVADFVERRYIREFVAVKRPAGRAHFQAILKHILRPERVAQAFAATGEQARNTLTADPGWPYMDLLKLNEVSDDTIQQLMSAALNRGYSIQTATHIRNVISSIFAHAIRTGCYAGINPASHVTLPAMTRREKHALDLSQLRRLFENMIYPERELALLAMFTKMNVAEICGLQWKYLNLSYAGNMVEHEFIPAKTIAVRLQSYRGEVSAVSESRRRFVGIPPLLSSVFHHLKRRDHFTAPDDFVLASRNGTPIRPENIAARRLKSHGRSLGMPWLTWSVFYQTRIRLKSEIGPMFHDEFDKIITTKPFPFSRLSAPQTRDFQDNGS